MKHLYPVLVAAILASCGVGPTKYKTDPPEVRAEQRTREAPEAPWDKPGCEDFQMTIDEYIIGVGINRRVALRYKTGYVLEISKDLSDFEGSVYLVGFDTTFDRWDLLDYAYLEFDGHAAAWLRGGEAGFDTGFDLGPYVEFHFEDEGEGDERGALAYIPEVTIDFRAVTPRRRIDFNYTLDLALCPTS